MEGNKQVSRSTSYPSLALGEALKKLQLLKKAHGIAGEYSRAATAQGMEYRSLSGTAARAVAALVHYGLLDRRKDQYSISDLGREYLAPIVEGGEREATKKAALRPALMRKLYDEYKGQPLPGQLKNILTITYGVQVSATDNAYRIIKQTFQLAGLLGDDDVVKNLEDKELPDDDADSPNNLKDKESRRPSGFKADLTEASSLQFDAGTEQGINISGDGWRLTVLLKTSKRHSATTRKAIRDLLEKADEVADDLYAEDDQG